MTPVIYHVDLETSKIYMQQITESITVKDFIRDVQKQGQSMEVNNFIQYGFSGPGISWLQIDMSSVIVSHNDINIIHQSVSHW